jgi:hypothetical protein
MDSKEEWAVNQLAFMNAVADSSGQRNRGWRGEDVIWGGIVEAFSRT